MNKTKYALITGAFGGLGEATIELLILKKYHIFACDVNIQLLEKYKNNHSITPIITDVSEDKSVENAFQIVFSKTSHLDVIIHLAGILIVGSIVEIPIEKIKKIIDINLLGVYRINKKFLPLLIKSKGRVVIVSSETGTQTSAPFNGGYAMSKHALEAYSDALRRELAFYNIKVIKFQPGAFKTSMTNSISEIFRKASEESKLFQKNIEKGASYLPKVQKKANNPKILAEKIIAALEAKKPKANYPIKQDRQRNFLELLPTKWADYIIKKSLS